MISAMSGAVGYLPRASRVFQENGEQKILFSRFGHNRVAYWWIAARKSKLGNVGRVWRPWNARGHPEGKSVLFGDDMVLMIDGNGSYSVKEAIRIGRILEEYDYAFYEEPLPWDWY